MIIIFDLDDTLYPEITYVHSGFRAVAGAAAGRWGADPQWAIQLMFDSLAGRGRGKQFDELTHALGVYSKSAVRWLVGVYRQHEPSISLPSPSREVLAQLAGSPLYLVTDGHKMVQARKVTALGLWGNFRRCYLTNRYGERHQKPSPYVFELIRRREGGVPASDSVYIGDNPYKDFSGIRPLGFRTIRLRQGSYRNVEVPENQDAEVSIDQISELLPILLDWGRVPFEPKL